MIPFYRKYKDEFVGIFRNNKVKILTVQYATSVLVVYDKIETKCV